MSESLSLRSRAEGEPPTANAEVGLEVAELPVVSSQEKAHSRDNMKPPTKTKSPFFCVSHINGKYTQTQILSNISGEILNAKGRSCCLIGVANQVDNSNQ